MVFSRDIHGHVDDLVAKPLVLTLGKDIYLPSAKSAALGKVTDWPSVL